MIARSACIFTLFVCAEFTLSAQTPRATNPLGNGPQVVEAGHALFNKTCTGCHYRISDGGEGSRGPELGGTRRYFTPERDGAIFGVVKNGIPGTAMPNMGLADDDAWRIVAYIRNIRGVAADNIVPGNPEHGMEIFKGKGGCMHNAT